jgi:hypothetical protein
MSDRAPRYYVHCSKAPEHEFFAISSLVMVNDGALGENPHMESAGNLSYAFLTGILPIHLQSDAGHRLIALPL